MNTLVLVHAFPVGAAMWRPQQRAFPGWTVLTPSLPGFDDRPLVATASIDDFAADLLAQLDARGVGKAVFCGVSMGGYTLFGMLRRASSRVAGLVLADTRATADSPEQQQGRRRAIALVEQDGPAALADDMLPKLLGETTRASRPDLVTETRGWISRQRSEALAAALEAMRTRPDSTPQLPSIDVPTCIVVGEEDTVTPASDAQAMASAIPGASLVTLPEAGHLSNVENAGAFNAAVAGFLARHFPQNVP